ncbi:hypothetical protein, partial [Okeania sp. SIO1H2]|uniref:hypothetical protein n=1 Tax=Okeania sp. SIO1H2 TaxID=2607775 RepID=UPI00257C700E
MVLAQYQPLISLARDFGYSDPAITNLLKSTGVEVSSQGIGKFSSRSGKLTLDFNREWGLFSSPKQERENPCLLSLQI